jgi:hypothetical protein
MPENRKRLSGRRIVTVSAKPCHPEVLVMGPANKQDVSFQLYVDMMVEYGVYLEADENDQFHEKLPRDLTRYKAIVIDQDLPVAKLVEKHRDYAAVKNRLRPYRKPKEFSWNENRNQFVWLHRLLMQDGVTVQHPAFLARGMARPDKKVIIDQCYAYYNENPVWLRYGNDVTFVNLGGMWRAARLYNHTDLQRKALSAAQDVLDMLERDELPCSKGPNRRLQCGCMMLEIWNDTGRRDRRMYKHAVDSMISLADARARAKQYRDGAPYTRAETISGLQDWALLGGMLKKPGYLDAALDVMKGGFDALFDRRKMLWAHYGVKGDRMGLTWGRGQNWVMYGLMGILEALPKTHNDWPLLASWVEMTAEGMRRSQDPVTGLWHHVMGEPSTRLEVSGTAHAVQHLCRAWRIGALKSSFVPDMLTRAWQGLKAHTFRNRTCTFAWGTGEGYDLPFYNTVPCGGALGYTYIAGADYVKTFGPLVPG